MKVFVITFDRNSYNQIMYVLKSHGLDVIPEEFNYLYPNKLYKIFGKNIKVIFITKNPADVIHSIIKNQKTHDILYIKEYYKKLNLNFNDYTDIFNKDIFNFENLFNSYYNNNTFSTLFIKYEKLYVQDKETIDTINSFLNITFTLDTFIHNKENTLYSDTDFTLSEKDKDHISVSFKNLQDKINSYTVKYRVSASQLIKKIIILKEKNSKNTKRHYRFSDVIFHNPFYWKESTEFILNQDHLKGSILRTYIENCPDNNLNKVNPMYLQCLKSIINQKINNGSYELPLISELVIHLRLGDVVVKNWFLNKNYINIIKQYINNNNISKVTFCTAFHYGNNVTQKLWIYSDKKHNKNINKLNIVFSNVLKHFNIVIDVRSSADIDSDFIYMIKAKYFVKDEGGFSKLTEELNNYMNK